MPAFFYSHIYEPVQATFDCWKVCRSAGSFQSRTEGPSGPHAQARKGPTRGSEAGTALSDLELEPKRSLDPVAKLVKGGRQ
jgi:hypothetical protein